MKDLLLNASLAAHCTDSDSLSATINNALRMNLGVIDAILDSKLVNEELFLKNLAAQLGLDWLDEVEIAEDDESELKKFCSPLIAAEQRFLPVSFASTGSNGSPFKVNVATYDPINLVARQALALLIRAASSVRPQFCSSLPLSRRSCRWGSQLRLSLRATEVLQYRPADSQLHRAAWLTLTCLNPVLSRRTLFQLLPTETEAS